MRRYAAKIDENQPGIVNELRKIPGVSVAVTSSLGHGFVDIIVGYLGAVNCMYEIKDPAKPPSARKLTKDEKQFHAAWRGHIKVVETAAEIITDLRAQARRITGRAA